MTIRKLSWQNLSRTSFALMKEVEFLTWISPWQIPWSQRWLNIIIIVINKCFDLSSKLGLHVNCNWGWQQSESANLITRTLDWCTFTILLWQTFWIHLWCKKYEKKYEYTSPQAKRHLSSVLWLSWLSSLDYFHLLTNFITG